MHKIFQRDQHMFFVYMNGILFCNGHRHVSVKHVAIFRVMGARIQIYL